MKENEAPEKLYISYEGYGVFGDDFSTERTRNSQIEYTRTDAFIEKAVEWLKEQDEMIGVSFQEDFLERFKNYMKGE